MLLESLTIPLSDMVLTSYQWVIPQLQIIMIAICMALNIQWGNINSDMRVIIGGAKHPATPCIRWICTGVIQRGNGLWSVCYIICTTTWSYLKKEREKNNEEFLKMAIQQPSQETEQWISQAHTNTCPHTAILDTQTKPRLGSLQRSKLQWG